jgi:glycosyltransferase involved in cell wall biosynthesis
VGIVGRYHPQKDYPNFFKAAKLLLEQKPDTHFIMIGRGVSVENSEVAAMISSLNVGNRVHLLGERQDVPEILSALDLFVSSSANEGFSNVVGEAMASGIPCAATDAGASAELLNGLCPVVPRNNPNELAGAALSILSLPRDARRDLGLKVRARIEGGYSLERMLSQYAELYRSCLPGASLPSGSQIPYGAAAQLS